jgi:hypothetical protein
MNMFLDKIKYNWSFLDPWMEQMAAILKFQKLKFLIISRDQESMNFFP